MAKLNKEDFISALKEMTILEVKELVDAMKEEFGVDPSAVAPYVLGHRIIAVNSMGDTRNSYRLIENIVGEIQVPVKRIFETKTEVVRTEIKKTPLANYAIGIQALDDKDSVFFDPFINKGTKLPYHSTEIEFFFDSKNMTEFPCLFIYGNPNNKKEWHLIKEVDLMQVAKGTSDENLPVRFSMNLDDNGSLRVDVSCSKSGQKLTISTLDSKFVKYE